MKKGAREGMQGRKKVGWRERRGREWPIGAPNEASSEGAGPSKKASSDPGKMMFRCLFSGAKCRYLVTFSLCLGPMASGLCVVTSHCAVT